MSTFFVDALNSHTKLSVRRAKSQSKIEEVQRRIAEHAELTRSDLVLFAAGSLGRLEVGTASDLDVFAISASTHGTSDSPITRLDTYEIFGRLIQVNRDLAFPRFSGDGRYLNIHSLKSLLDRTGQPIDDSENTFTTRMLLLLECRSLSNHACYDVVLNRLVVHYFRDEVGKKAFRPLFLLNDLLRYWRTLCLNYEEVRNDPNRLWFKKNMNLKFCRRLTVFSTVLCIVSGKFNGTDTVAPLLSRTPLDRLAAALDALEAEHELGSDFHQALDDYELFLSAKEDSRKDVAAPDPELSDHAERFSRFFVSALQHKNVAPELFRFVVC